MRDKNPDCSECDCESLAFELILKQSPEKMHRLPNHCNRREEIAAARSDQRSIIEQATPCALLELDRLDSVERDVDGLV